MLVYQRVIPAACNPWTTSWPFLLGIWAQMRPETSCAVDTVQRTASITCPVAVYGDGYPTIQWCEGVKATNLGNFAA